MITWLIGENSFEIREAVKAIEQQFDGTVERYDAADLSLARLPDLLMGVSLFATERLVIISELSQNTHLWEKLPDWLPRVNDTIHLVFTDTKPDKRKVSYKALKAVADVHEYAVWSERDTVKAEQWLLARAEAQKIPLGRNEAGHIVSRVGLDQWQLAEALEMLSLLDEITVATIHDVIPPHPQENIFQLFETALDGKASEVASKVSTLSLTEDPYALFALLSSQGVTLAAVTYAEEGSDPAKEFAIHPFVASKLARHGKRLGKQQVGRIVEVLAHTDADMKRSKAEPWLLIEKALLEIAT